MSNVQRARDIYAAFNRGDIATVLGAFDSGIEWHEAEGNPYIPSGSPLIGPDAVMHDVFMRIGADFDGFTVHPKSFHEAGDAVVMEGRYTGTFKATGKSLDAQVCHLLTFRDGKMTGFQQYVDTAQMQDVMGARTPV